MHSDGIWNNVELQREILKTGTVKGAFWQYLELQRILLVHSGGIRNNLELQKKNNENRVGKWCILKVFKMIILKQGCLCVHYYIFWNNIYLNLQWENQYRFWLHSGTLAHSETILNDILEIRRTFWKLGQ